MTMLSLSITGTGILVVSRALLNLKLLLSQATWATFEMCTSVVACSVGGLLLSALSRTYSSLIFPALKGRIC